jgi:hypothetical protein
MLTHSRTSLSLIHEHQELIMAGNSDSAKVTLPNPNGLSADLAETLKQYASTGSFALRRILYFQRKNTDGGLPEKPDANVASQVL